LIAASKDAAPGAAPNDSVDALHALILHQLDEDQAQETISIPLAGKSSIADHMVIASGRSTRHVSAIADKLAQRIKQGVEGLAPFGADTHSVTVSIGIGLYIPGTQQDLASLLSTADEALYRAKAKGRNRVEGPLD
jgi:diguanylate cyclase (GGDEF)-like protein